MWTRDSDVDTTRINHSKCLLTDTDTTHSYHTYRKLHECKRNRGKYLCNRVAELHQCPHFCGVKTSTKKDKDLVKIN